MEVAKVCPATFPYATKPPINVGNGIFLPHRYTKVIIRAEVLATDPKRGERMLPELSVQGIPHTDHNIHEIFQRQSQTNRFSIKDALGRPEFHPMFLEEAYERCKIICAEHAKTFYLGTLKNTFLFKIYF